MCGRFALPVPRAVLQERFGLDLPESYRPRHNIAPGQEVLALVSGDSRAFRTLRWGLVPPWAGRGRGPGLLVNIRSETAWTKTWFRDLGPGQRCLIPASAFYEWMSAPGGRPHPARPGPGGPVRVRAGRAVGRSRGRRRAGRGPVARC